MRIKPRERKRKKKHPCICCNAMNTFLEADCFTCRICETITDTSVNSLSNSYFPLIENERVPGTLEYLSSILMAHADGDLEKCRMLIFNGFSSADILNQAFRGSGDCESKEQVAAIDSGSFEEFFNKLTALKCPFFIQTLMASLDHLARRPGIKIESIRWIILALLVPFLSRKKNCTETAFHYSLARRLLSLTRHVSENDLEWTWVLDTLTAPLLRRLAEIANWTLNLRIGKIFGVESYSVKCKARILASDWVIQAGARVLQLVSESNMRIHRLEPSELYSMAIDMVPVDVILSDWHQYLAYARKSSFKQHGNYGNSRPNADKEMAKFHAISKKKKFLISSHPAIISLGIKSRLVESELVPNGSFGLGGPIPLHLHIPRFPTETMLQYSALYLMNASELQLHGRIKVEFLNEAGVDAGGLLREWLQVLCKALMEPELGIFIGGDEGFFEIEAPCVWFSPNRSVKQNEAAPIFTRVLGIALGIAFNNGIMIDHRLPSALFKKLIFPDKEKPPCIPSRDESDLFLTLDDLSEIAPGLAKGLGHLLDFDPKDSNSSFEEVFGLDFTITIGKDHQALELVPNGSYTNVTMENKHIYISEFLNFIFNNGESLLWDAFRSGFYSTIAGRAIELISPKELKQLLSGDEATISVELLRSVALYEGYLTPTHPISHWLWEILESWSPGMRKKFLVFVTGAGRLPVALAAAGAAGHSVMPNHDGPWIFRVWGRNVYWKAPSGGEYRPLGRTCFNQLCLYSGYPDKETMERLLRSAVIESQGFGIE